MITERDIKVIKWLSDDNHKIARTETIAAVWYGSNLRVAQRRLKALFENGILERRRDIFSMEYLWVSKNRKVEQVKHSLLYTDLLLYMTKHGIVIERSIAEYSIGNVRSDGVLIYKYLDKKYIAFIEIQTKESRHSADLQKYMELYYSNVCQEKWGVFPTIIVVSNKRIDILDVLNVIQIKEDFSNIDQLLMGE